MFSIITRMNSEIPLERKVADYLSDFYAQQHNFSLGLKNNLQNTILHTQNHQCIFFYLTWRNALDSDSGELLFPLPAKIIIFLLALRNLVSCGDLMVTSQVPY